MHLNTTDFIIIAILSFSVIIGLIRGFVREVISLITWFVAFVAAFKFSPMVADLFHATIAQTMTRFIVAGLLIFVVILIVGFIVNKLIHLLISITGFGFFDRLLGMIFGALRGALTVSVMLLLIGASTYKDADWMKQSTLSPHFQPIAKQFVPLLPTELKTMVASLMNRLGDAQNHPQHTLLVA